MLGRSRQKVAVRKVAALAAMTGSGIMPSSQVPVRLAGTAAVPAAPAASCQPGPPGGGRPEDGLAVGGTRCPCCSRPGGRGCPLASVGADGRAGDDLQQRMWLGFLGPLIVRLDGAEQPVMPARLRIMLTALGLEPGRAMSPETLAGVLWDNDPPGGAAVTVRSYVKRLRRALGPQAAGRIVTRAPGYLLDAGEGEVDVLVFQSLCGQGGVAAREGDWARSADLLGRALGLWRGMPLADVPSEVLRHERVSSLEELRLHALEGRVAADLNLGEHVRLVPELQALAAADPFREIFHCQLMTALYRAGRQGEALDAYRRARETLVAELGVEPGKDLQQLHRVILSGAEA